MSWWDRVLAAPVRDLPVDPMPGRYLVHTDATLTINGVSARAGDHLAATASGQWSVSKTGSKTRRGRFLEPELLRSLEASSLVGIAERLLLTGGGGRLEWSRLAGESPLVRPAPEQLEPTRIDREITRHGPHLLEVCRRPHSVLDAVIEPTAASRAKRIPPRAVHYLAGHSEDWHRRTVTSVIPRRILAQRVDERLDVYENRVVSRLVDDLLSYFRSRLADLRELGDLFSDVADFSAALSAQHRVARRLSELWGEGFGEGEELDRIQLLEQGLLDRRRRVGGLQDSDLYRAVPRRAKVTGELRQTNVLTDHQHYRRVAALWQAVVLERMSDATRQDEYAAWQTKMRAFDVFCLLLVVTAVDRLGFKPSAANHLNLSTNSAIRLEGVFGILELKWEPARGIVLSRGSHLELRFVPVAAAIAGVDEAATEANERRARGRVDELTRAPFDRAVGSATVVLYPATRRQRGSFPWDLSRGLNPDDVGLATTPEGANPRLLPVSPLDILSLERVERVVRRVVLVRLLERFPARAECRRNVRERVVGMADWLEPSSSRDHVSVTAPPDEARLDGLARAIKEAQRGLRPRQDDAIRTALDSVHPAVEATRSYFDQIRTCPVCGGAGAFLGRGASHFVVECGECDSSWGLDACGKCGGRVPYLNAGAARPESGDVFALGMLDRSFGRDVLAIPCVRTGAEEEYVCPRCRACTGSDETCGPNCARAAASTGAETAPMARGLVNPGAVR